MSTNDLIGLYFCFIAVGILVFARPAHADDAADDGIATTLAAPAASLIDAVFGGEDDD